MKVNNALICLDCDEIFNNDEDLCPFCNNRFNVRLSDFVPPLSDSIVRKRVPMIVKTKEESYFANCRN